jgi:hypothetical protein
MEHRVGRRLSASHGDSDLLKRGSLQQLKTWMHSSIILLERHLFKNQTCRMFERMMNRHGILRALNTLSAFRPVFAILLLLALTFGQDGSFTAPPMSGAEQELLQEEFLPPLLTIQLGNDSVRHLDPQAKASTLLRALHPVGPLVVWNDCVDLQSRVFVTRLLYTQTTSSLL